MTPLLEKWGGCCPPIPPPMSRIQSDAVSTGLSVSGFATPVDDTSDVKFGKVSYVFGWKKAGCILYLCIHVQACHRG